MGAHVLLVEDNAGDTLLVQRALASHSVVHVARDGEQALQMLADQNLKLDLVILDLNIPRIPGLGVLARFRPKPIPVVVFSASCTPHDKRLALTLGAADYVEKPIDFEMYMDVVCEMVEKWSEGGKTATVS